MPEKSAQDETQPTAFAGYIEFEFALPLALLERLVEVFDQISSAELNSNNVQQIPEEQGVYQLFLDNQLVYVGKTDAEAGLRNRLLRHATKTIHRIGLDPTRVTFKAVRVFVFTAMDLESDLIRHYGGVVKLAWNGSGFGSNDPGRERDTTKVKGFNFDAIFPIDIDQRLELSVLEGELASEVMVRLKHALPFTLRFQNRGGRSRQPHSDFDETRLKALSSPTSARLLIEHIVSQLPEGWHATALPGYIIMYKHDDRSFPSGSIISRSTSTPT